MKLILFIFLISSYVSAQTIEYETIDISLTKGSPSVSCELDSISKFYICPGEKNAILVKRDSDGFTAIVEDEDSLPSVTTVNLVTSKGKILHQEQERAKFNPYGGFPNGTESTAVPKKIRNLRTQAQLTVSTVSFFFNSPIEENIALNGSDNFKKISGKYLNQTYLLKKAAEAIPNENNYQIKLSNGKLLNCSREERRDLTAQELAWEKDNASSILCPSFKCESLNINGTSYQSNLIFYSNSEDAMPSLYLTHDKGLGPNVTISTLRTSKTTIPIYQNVFAPQDAPATQSSILNASGDLLHPDTGFKLETISKICTNKAEAFANILTARETLLTEVANTQVAQYISMFNGSSDANFLDIPSAQKLGCLHKGVYYDPEAAKHLDFFEKRNTLQSVDHTITINKATDLFNEAAAMKDIAWKYKVDGCYARAHLMARRFEAEGIKVDKVWLSGKLSVPEDKVDWMYHVAPIVYVKNSEGKVSKMVIDPSLFDRPVTVDEWDKKIQKRSVKKVSENTNFPFPMNAYFYERPTIAFSSSDPYLPTDNMNLTEQEKTKMAEDIMKLYKEYE